MTMLRGRAGLVPVIATLTLCASLSPVPLAAHELACDFKRAEAIGERMAELTGKMPSFSGRIVITHCRKVILDELRGTADRSTNEPIDETTLFDVGSLTKQFVAAAILDLRDQGELSLDDSFADYFQGLPSKTGAITLHQALTHSSGLPLYSGDDYQQTSRAEFLSWLSSVPLEFEPGQSEAYSNPGFTALAMIVEQVSGLKFEQYLQERLLRPQGIDNTGYRMVSGPVVINYAADGTRDGSPLEHAWGPWGPYWNLMGNGGMLSDAEQMARWFDRLRQGLVLSTASTNEIFAAHVPTTNRQGVSNGYGWRIIDDERGHWINHGGSNGATFFADIRWFQDSNATMSITLNTFDLETIQALVRGFADVAGKPSLQERKASSE